MGTCRLGITTTFLTLYSTLTHCSCLQRYLDRDSIITEVSLSFWVLDRWLYGPRKSAAHTFTSSITIPDIYLVVIFKAGISWRSSLLFFMLLSMSQMFSISKDDFQYAIYDTNKTKNIYHADILLSRYKPELSNSVTTSVIHN